MRVSRSGARLKALQRLGEPLGVGGRDEDTVVAIGDDVGVAGDVRGEHRRAGRERLGEDHPEALAGERGSAQEVGLRQPAPELGAADPAERPDPAQRLVLGDVALDLGALGADHDELGVVVLDQGLERRQQHWQALALLGTPDEDQPQRVARSLRAGRRRVHVDAVRDHVVVAAEPAAPGPGGGLGHRDPGRELVELASHPGEGRDVVEQRLRRVGVEGGDDRRARV